MKNLENYAKHSEDNGFSIHLSEKDFIKMKLHYFIESNAKYDYSHDPSRVDDMTLTYRLVLIEILKNFNLKELWTIFLLEDSYLGRESFMIEMREELIENINEDPEYSDLERKMFKKKIWDMPIVLFALIAHLIQISDLFLLAETDDFAFPNLNKVKINYIDFYKADN